MNLKLFLASLLLTCFATPTFGQDDTVANPRAVAELQANLCKQLEHLLTFKDTDKFKKFGFGAGGPYSTWLKEIEKLRNVDSKQLPKDAPPNLRFVSGEMLQLGMDFVQNGHETDYAKNILPEMKATIGYEFYLAKKAAEKLKKRLQAKRKWIDSTGEFEVEAQLINYKGGVLTLRKEDGQNISVPLSKINSKDRDLIQQAFELPDDLVDTQSSERPLR